MPRDEKKGRCTGLRESCNSCASVWKGGDRNAREVAGRYGRVSRAQAQRRRPLRALPEVNGAQWRCCAAVVGARAARPPHKQAKTQESKAQRLFVNLRLISCRNPTGTINSSRPEHTKRTQGNAGQRKATHTGQAEPTQQVQHQQTENRTSCIPLETTDDQKPKPTHRPQAPSRSPPQLRSPRSKPPTEAYLNRAVQANQTRQGPPWILPASPVSSGGVHKQRPSTSLTASLRAECAYQ